MSKTVSCDGANARSVQGLTLIFLFYVQHLHNLTGSPSHVGGLEKRTNYSMKRDNKLIFQSKRLLKAVRDGKYMLFTPSTVTEGGQAGLFTRLM